MLRNIFRHSYFILLFVLMSVIYFVARPMVTLDSYWVIPTSLSLLNEGNFDLDEYRNYGLEESYAAIRMENHYFNYFPYGISILITPIVSVLNLFFKEALFFKYHAHLEKLCASILILFSLSILYKLSTYFLSNRMAAILVFVIGLGTPLLSSGSRALWQHSGSVLLLSLALLLLVSKKQTKVSITFLGVILVFAYVVRPTNIIPLIFISFFVFYLYPVQRLNYLSSILISFCIFFLINYSTFGEIFHPYYQSNRLSFDWDVFRIALLGNLFSPNRGIFIWSPVLLIIFLTFFISIRYKIIALLCVSIIILHSLAISMFPHWWGGHSVGPRFFTDIIPFFVLILSLVWKKFRKNHLFTLTFLILATISMSIHISASFSKRTQLWNIRGGDVNEFPERIWDWNKPQFFPFE